MIRRYSRTEIIKAMRITKDEATILAHALSQSKYEYVDRIGITKEEDLKIIKELNELQSRLEILSKDQRRTGRKSQDSFSDVLKRYCLK